MIDKEYERSSGSRSPGEATKASGAASRETTSASSNTELAKTRKVFEELPGTNEGKAALLEFEMTDFDFVEEQQIFDFGVEFKDAPPTAAMLPKTELLHAMTDGVFEGVPDDDEAVFLGDDDAQLDFEEAARMIALEEAAAARASAAGRDEPIDRNRTMKVDETAGEMGGQMVDAMIVDETTLPRLKVSTNEELLRAIQSIPSKMAFKIGEVAEMVGVKQYVLRYWESEFDALKPRKSKNGQRVYTRRDVETALMIRKLLYSDRFSIEGARGALRQLKGRVREEKDWKQVLNNHEHVCEGLRGLVSEIRKLRDALN